MERYGRRDAGASGRRSAILQSVSAAEIRSGKGTGGGKVLPVPLKSRKTGAGRVQEKVLADLYPI